MSIDQIVALGRKIEIKYSNKTTSYTEDKTWINSINILHNMFSEIKKIESILDNDTNIDFSDLRDELDDAQKTLTNISSEITFRIGNLYGNVSSDVYNDVYLPREYQMHRK